MSHFMWDLEEVFRIGIGILMETLGKLVKKILINKNVFNLIQ